MPKNNAQHPGKVVKGTPIREKRNDVVSVPRNVAMEAALNEASAYLDTIAANFGLEPYDLHMLLQMIDNRCLAAMVTMSTNQVMAGLKIAREQDVKGANPPKPEEGGADDRT